MHYFFFSGFLIEHSSYSSPGNDVGVVKILARLKVNFKRSARPLLKEMMLNC